MRLNNKKKVNSDAEYLEKIKLLEQKIENLESKLIVTENDNYKKFNDLEKEFKDFRSRVSHIDNFYGKSLNTTNYLFNTLFIDYELSPKPLLKNIQDLSKELLKFVGNVCNKYDLEYWLDYGNLLGAVRHGDFIPWDDDLDIGMMRGDYNTLIEVMPYEIEKNELDNITLHYRDTIFNNQKTGGFFQLLCWHWTLFGSIDIFPYDYIKSYDGRTDFEDYFERTRQNFFTDILDGLDMETVLDRYYDNLNLSYDKQEFFISGVEGSRGPIGMSKLEFIETDKVFPLKHVKFGDITAPVPKDSDYYLKLIYGDYMKIPKILAYHARADLFRGRDDVNDVFEEDISKLRKANENFC